MHAFGGGGKLCGGVVVRDQEREREREREIERERERERDWDTVSSERSRDDAYSGTGISTDYLLL